MSAAIAILLLAAGASSRMRGADKLMEEVEGLPLLHRQALNALAASDSVYVTLPCGPSARRDALHGLDITCIDVPDASEGMAASLRTGVAALPHGTDAVMVLPGDMPGLDADALKAVMAQFDLGEPGVIRGATHDGAPGHPVILPARLFPRLLALTGDVGARAVLRDETATLVSLPGDAAVLDLDTPEAWSAWRACQR